MEQNEIDALGKHLAETAAAQLRESGKTHFADDATLEYIRKLEEDLASEKLRLNKMSSNQATAKSCLSLVDNLLSQAGYSPESSVKHSLDIAKSLL